MLRPIARQPVALRIPVESPRAPTFNEALVWARKSRSRRPQAWMGLA
jgi:hypothetical protein